MWHRPMGCMLCTGARGRGQPQLSPIAQDAQCPSTTYTADTAQLPHPFPGCMCHAGCPALPPSTHMAGSPTCSTGSLTPRHHVYSTYLQCRQCGSLCHAYSSGTPASSWLLGQEQPGGREGKARVAARWTVGHMLPVRQP